MLSVFRDGTLHGQAELTAHGLRIGRGSENDIVLEDAAKRVSRLHAELRLEASGAITLTDLQSANGTWIAGERVDTEALEPGVPFTIGPYRLMLEEQAHTQGAGAGDSGEAVAVESAGGAAPPSAASPAPPSQPGVRRKGDTTKTQAWKSAAGVIDLAVKHRWAALIGGAAVVGLTGLGIWALSQPGDASSADPSTNVNPPPVTPPETTPAPPPPVDPNVAHLDEADRLLVQGDKPSAETALRDHILIVLQQDPTNARALEQKGVAERIITPVTPPVRPPGTPNPRVDVRPVDTRPTQHQQRLTEARSAFERDDFKGALQVLDSLISDAPDYADAVTLRQRVVAARLGAAKRQIAEAEELVKNGKLPEAIDAFRKAAGIDPSVSVDPRIADVQARMAKEGYDAFLDGINYAQGGRADQAIPLLEKAWRYLPEGHKDRPTIRAELTRLGSPPK